MEDVPGQGRQLGFKLAVRQTSPTRRPRDDVARICNRVRCERVGAAQHPMFDPAQHGQGAHVHGQVDRAKLAPVDAKNDGFGGFGAHRAHGVHGADFTVKVGVDSRPGDIELHHRPFRPGGHIGKRVKDGLPPGSTLWFGPDRCDRVDKLGLASHF